MAFRLLKFKGFSSLLWIPRTPRDYVRHCSWGLGEGVGSAWGSATILR